MLYLSSSSPRRKTLLQQLNIEFQQISIPIDETIQDRERPMSYVSRMAREKAIAGWNHIVEEKKTIMPVLAADTCVNLQGDVLGKPRHLHDGLAMLLRLSGKSHVVLTAVSICFKDKVETILSASKVKMKTFSETEALTYWRTGEPQDKAGAYAIQGLGAVLIEKIEGSYSGIMGLPLYETANLLKKFNIHCL